MNSPASAVNSTMAPWSTIIMHWPSLTTMTEPLVLTLSEPLVLLPRLVWRFTPLATKTFSERLSQ